MAAKKKKLTDASTSSRLSTGTIPLYALKAKHQSSLGKKVADQIVKRQEDEEIPRTWPLQPPMIGDCSGEKCSGWDSNDNKSNEDEKRAEISRKAKLKKENSQASAVMISAREKEIATVHNRQLDFPLAIVSNSTEQDVDEGIKVIDSMIIEDSCVASTSQPLGVVSEIFVSKPTVLETESSIKLVEKIARQERDLKSAETQDGSLRAVIETLDHKHRLEMQKQMNQLSENYQKEMDAMKLDLKEAEAARQKASTDLRKAKEKNSAVRTERRELGLKLAAVSEEVAAGLTSASTSRPLQDLEQKYDSLKDNYYTLEDKYNELDDDAAGYCSELQKYKRYAESCRRKRETIKIELERVEKRLNDMTTKNMNELHSRESISQIYQKLRNAYDLREPLVKIGVDIRWRFLDQAREIALNIPRDEADMALRTNGNIAAHRDNAADEGAPFKCNLVPKEYEDKAEKTSRSYTNRSQESTPSGLELWKVRWTVEQQ
ncbi:b65ab3ff-a7ed-4b16-a167-9d19c867f026 [Sclerotinia trifoliorum]|uniref:B65ab3ff-a7ed-4b16-a167-9d19c867f026 n=1 Tax=Sclerotinia trifoliorum TaxID=28548 RepID=A0A8H2W6R6_9HELO|nr:b65ab3ff-a7ed-4b16-a167-9d19c867f026 [Sclerotinia trifoliorum]